MPASGCSWFSPSCSSLIWSPRTVTSPSRAGGGPDALLGGGGGGVLPARAHTRGRQRWVIGSHRQVLERSAAAPGRPAAPCPCGLPGHPRPRSLPEDSPPLRDGLRGHQVDVRQIPGDPDSSGEKPQVHQQVPERKKTGSGGSRSSPPPPSPTQYSPAKIVPIGGEAVSAPQPPAQPLRRGPRSSSSSSSGRRRRHAASASPHLTPPAAARRK